MLDQSVVELIRPDLRPEERVLWAGRPGGGARFRWAYLAQLPFAIAWTCFTVFWEAMVLLGGAPWYMALFGLPFLLVGLHMLIGRFVLDTLDRRRTVYAVTSERLLIVRPGIFGRMLMQTGLRNIVGVVPSVKPDGRGTLKFQPRSPESWSTEVSAWSTIGRILEGFLNPLRIPAAEFEMVPGAQQVSESINKAREELSAAAE